MSTAIAESEIPEPDPKHIANFGRLEPWLMRGDQPDSEGYKWLAAHGIKIMVNFRLRNKDKKIAKVAPQLESVRIPVKNDCAPNDSQALEWLQLCARNAPACPIFAHCRGGAGRTSTFCALVRIAQGWTLAEAILEQRKFGFKPEAEHKKQAQFLSDFYERKGTGRILTPNLESAGRQD